MSQFFPQKRPGHHKTLSSPMLKARKERMRRHQRQFLLLSIWLSPFLVIVLLCGLHVRRSTSAALADSDILAPTDVNVVLSVDEDEHSFQPLSAMIDEASPIGPQALTAILPVTQDSISTLSNVLDTLIHKSASLQEIIITCPQIVVSEARQILWKIISAPAIHQHPELSLHPFTEDVDPSASVLHAAADASTDWVLLLDQDGLDDFDEGTQDMLLNPLSIPLPAGPRGFSPSSFNTSCLRSSRVPQPATFLVPPFVSPTPLLSAISESAESDIRNWVMFGDAVAQQRLDMVGGLVLGAGESSVDMEWCSRLSRRSTSPPDIALDPILFLSPEIKQGQVVVADEQVYVESQVEAAPKNSTQTGLFVLIFDSLEELRLFSSAACKLQNDGNKLEIMLSSSGDNATESTSDDVQGYFITTATCDLSYQVLQGTETNNQYNYVLQGWLHDLPVQPDVVINTVDHDIALVFEHGQSQLNEVVSLRIPRADLPYSDWMGSLRIEEWRQWRVPRVDITVVTHDRPRSLTRLLASLTEGKYFGDRADIRINMDQTTDNETMKIVNAFRWNNGALSVSHRVIHGGLLPAVVESWYPSSNDSYGLILEDDVELSPLFYAWIKMTVLRYRYGGDSSNNMASRMFGISLYQQKTIELRPEGRRPFNARALFASEGLPSNMPYLSQIPCSWGAVYFPEHWREFHTYLAARFSESSISIDETVVPDVRSNKWAKSWKKYFIELVYLRGYFMLYPNYEDFKSLSTNHLEVGSHVKDTPKDVYDQKKDLFFLTLLGVPEEDGQPISTGLLEISGERLPSWSDLPLLDLKASLVSPDILMDRGKARRKELFGCTASAIMAFNVEDLLCR